MTDLIAHQGGWDEVLLLVLPVVVAVVAVRWAERRAKKDRVEQGTGDGEGTVEPDEAD